MSGRVWMGRALCAGTSPELFFPEQGGTCAPARRICLACEVRPDCLAFALATEAPFHRDGVWGGTTPDERALIAGDGKRRHGRKDAAA